jgi:hypothetical protein
MAVDNIADLGKGGLTFSILQQDPGENPGLETIRSQG